MSRIRFEIKDKMDFYMSLFGAYVILVISIIVLSMIFQSGFFLTVAFYMVIIPLGGFLIFVLYNLFKSIWKGMKDNFKIRFEK